MPHVPNLHHHPSHYRGQEEVTCLESLFLSHMLARCTATEQGWWNPFKPWVNNAHWCFASLSYLYEYLHQLFKCDTMYTLKHCLKQRRCQSMLDEYQTFIKKMHMLNEKVLCKFNHWSLQLSPVMEHLIVSYQAKTCHMAETKLTHVSLHRENYLRFSHKLQQQLFSTHSLHIKQLAKLNGLFKNAH